MSGSGSTFAASDVKYAQQTNTALQYPNSVDAYPGMQRPEMPGGPDANAPLNPRYVQTAEHYPVDPTSLGMKQYGTLTAVEDNPQTQPEE
jgi:hypothetical protein